jgi:hypothetical protein
MVIVLSFLNGSSEGERKTVDPVVGGTDRPLDQGQPAAIVQGTPGARGGPRRIKFSDLLDGSVFDERTGAEAISHGKSPARFSVAAGGAGCEGRFVPAGDLKLI